VDTHPRQTAGSALAEKLEQVARPFLGPKRRLASERVGGRAQDQGLRAAANGRHLPSYVPRQLGHLLSRADIATPCGVLNDDPRVVDDVRR
jgi:hypothetical protein